MKAVRHWKELGIGSANRFLLAGQLLHRTMKLRANSYRRIYIVRGENQCQTSSSTCLHQRCLALEITRDRFVKPILASGDAIPSYDEAARQFLSKDLRSSWRKPVPNVVINRPT